MPSLDLDIELVSALILATVGWCSRCGERAYLRIKGGKRFVTCGCGVNVPGAFFAAAARGGS